MLNALVEKVVIHEREIVRETWHQRVDIYYNFVGNVGECMGVFADRRFRG